MAYLLTTNAFSITFAHLNVPTDILQTFARFFQLAHLGQDEGLHKFAHSLKNRSLLPSGKLLDKQQCWHVFLPGPDVFSTIWKQPAVTLSL